MAFLHVSNRDEWGSTSGTMLLPCFPSEDTTPGVQRWELFFESIWRDRQTNPEDTEGVRNHAPVNRQRLHWEWHQSFSIRVLWSSGAPRQGVKIRWRQLEGQIPPYPHMKGWFIGAHISVCDSLWGASIPAKHLTCRETVNMIYF